MSVPFDLLDGENGLKLADNGSSALLCIGMALGRSFGVCGASPLTFDKIDFRISLLCVFGRIADDPLSNDDFLNNVFGVAGVSNSLNARTFRYGGDSKCIFDCTNVLCRSGRIIWLSKIGNN